MKKRWPRPIVLYVGQPGGMGLLKQPTWSHSVRGPWERAYGRGLPAPFSNISVEITPLKMLRQRSLRMVASICLSIPFLAFLDVP